MLCMTIHASITSSIEGLRSGETQEHILATLLLPEAARLGLCNNICCPSVTLPFRIDADNKFPDLQHIDRDTICVA